MKNILILIPVVLLIAACNCDETHPLVGGEDLEIPDVFVVTNVSYTTIIRDNEEFEGIEVLFNRRVNPDLVIDSLSLFLEGPDIDFSGSFLVQDNWVFIPCGYFYCLGAGDCKATIRLSGESNTGIRSLDDRLLDGDRDGAAGGDFIQEVSVTGCGRLHFGLSVFPEEDSIPVSPNLNDPLVFRIDFDPDADPSTIRLDTGDDNIRIIHVNDDELIPFEHTTIGNGGISAIDLIVDHPGEYCGGQACVFRVIVEESVHSLLGAPLDGDGNGTPGGDFTKDYTLYPASGPLLQLKLPGTDTTWLDWQPFDSTVVVDFSFSLPVGPNNLTFSRDFSFYCSNGDMIDYSQFQFRWQPGSDEHGWLEFPYWVPNEFCSGIDTINGQFVTLLKVVVSDRVHSTTGNQLDGDYDGVAGENAVKYFVLPEQ